MCSVPARGTQDTHAGATREMVIEVNAEGIRTAALCKLIASGPHVAERRHYVVNSALFVVLVDQGGAQADGARRETDRRAVARRQRFSSETELSRHFERF